MPQDNKELAAANKAVADANAGLKAVLDGLGDTSGKEILGGVRGVVQTCLNHLEDEAASLDTIGKEVKQVNP